MSAEASPSAGASNKYLQDLLGEVLQEHNREVAELSEEISRLRSQLAAPLSLSAPSAPSSDARASDSGESAKQDSPAGSEEADGEQEERKASAGADSMLASAGVDSMLASAGADSMLSRISDGSCASRVMELLSAPKQVKPNSVASLLKVEVNAQKSRLQYCVDGPLETLSSVVIVLNIVFLCVQLQWEGEQLGDRTTYGRGGSSMTDTDASMLSGVINHCFNAFFLAELVLRFFSYRAKFLYGHEGVEWFNFFDFFLVFSASLDLYILTPMENAMKVNLSILRPFRLLRLVRLLRFVETAKIFMSLRILVKTVAASFCALFWSIVLLFVVMLMASLFLCSTVRDVLEDPEVRLETKDWTYRHYGTAARAFYTVFELTFSGGWPNYARPLVENVTPWYAAFFLVYIVSIVFALFRIITALFLRDTMALAADDAKIGVQQKMAQKAKVATKLLEFFQAADVSGDGVLSSEEFDNAVRNEEVRAWLSLMGLDVHETHTLFTLISNNTGCVTQQQFVDGMLRLKGEARADDVFEITLVSRRILADLAGLKRNVHVLSRAASKSDALQKDPTFAI